MIKRLIFQYSDYFYSLILINIGKINEYKLYRCMVIILLNSKS